MNFIYFLGPVKYDDFTFTITPESDTQVTLVYGPYNTDDINVDDRFWSWNVFTSRKSSI